MFVFFIDTFTTSIINTFKFRYRCRKFNSYENWLPIACQKCILINNSFMDVCFVFFFQFCWMGSSWNHFGYCWMSDFILLIIRSPCVIVVRTCSNPLIFLINHNLPYDFKHEFYAAQWRHKFINFFLDVSCCKAKVWLKFFAIRHVYFFLSSY